MSKYQKYRSAHKKEINSRTIEYRKKYLLTDAGKVYHHRRLEHGKVLWLLDKLNALCIYSHGSMKCEICEEDRLGCLSIDHIDGGGRKHREEIKGHIYRWLKENEFPIGFRVLCMNCQFLEEERKRMGVDK
jgi:hypothetical protein